jgi:hypothetical protein
MLAATVDAVTALMDVPTGFLRDVLVAERADPVLCSPEPDEGLPACPPQPGDPESTVNVDWSTGRVPVAGFPGPCVPGWP